MLFGQNTDYLKRGAHIFVSEDNSETEEKTPKPEESTTPTTHTDTSENSDHSESDAGNDEE